HRALRLPPRFPAQLRAARAHAARAGGTARAVARFGMGLSDQGCGGGDRIDRGRHAPRFGARARRAGRARAALRGEVGMAQDPKRTKFIFVTGGVVSSLGKGLASASIGALLESRGLKVSILKMDPYINVDPGTMSPFQHGEVFVTDDGAETDLDLGHYERFLSVRMSQKNNFTTGQIYWDVLQ